MGSWNLVLDSTELAILRDALTFSMKVYEKERLCRKVFSGCEAQDLLDGALSIINIFKEGSHDYSGRSVMNALNALILRVSYFHIRSESVPAEQTECLNRASSLELLRHKCYESAGSEREALDSPVFFLDFEECENLLLSQVHI